ncbi:MAG: hypothetical protein NT127_09025 [Sphingobacteriales bacterium]|nr:hypothetical protein [Sphingobacteriales bacterium]
MKIGFFVFEAFVVCCLTVGRIFHLDTLLRSGSLVFGVWRWKQFLFADFTSFREKFL